MKAPQFARSLGALLVSLALAPVALSQAAADNKPAPAKVGAQLRLDSVGTYTETEGSPGERSQSFKLTTARLGVTGDLASDLSYTLRLNLRSTSNYQADRSGPDGAMAALDRAYIEHRIIPGLALRAGRMPLVSGSIEADYSSIDQYVYSYTSDVYVALSPVQTGADLTYTFGSHAVAIAAQNGFQDGDVAQKGPQQGENMSLGLGYRGTIAGMVKPIITYNQFNRIRNGKGDQRDDKATHTAYAVGAQVSFAGLDLDLEYDTINKVEFTSYEQDDAPTPATVEVKNPEEKITGVIAQAAYTLTAAKLRFAAKVTSDSHEVDGEEVFKSARNSLAVEYRPGPKNFRYHLAMVNLKDEKGAPDASGDIELTPTDTRQYILGMAAKM